MCCGLTKTALMVRVGKDWYREALALPRARSMDFTGRPLAGMVYVDPPGYRTGAALARWVQRGVDFATSGAKPAAGGRRKGSARRGANHRSGFQLSKRRISSACSSGGISGAGSFPSALAVWHGVVVER